MLQCGWQLPRTVLQGEIGDSQKLVTSLSKGGLQKTCQDYCQHKNFLELLWQLFRSIHRQVRSCVGVRLTCTSSTCRPEVRRVHAINLTSMIYISQL